MTTPHDPGALADAKRLAALREAGLEAASDPVFDTFARLVRRLLDAPVALVSLVDDARQWFPGALGLPEPYQDQRQTPLTHSFCQYVVTSGDALVVEDARQDAVLCDNLAVRDLAVVAYAGMPLRDSDGLVLGSLCAIDGRPRRWTADQLDTLRDLAAACSSELRSRISSARAQEAHREAEHARQEAQRDRDLARRAAERLRLAARVTAAMGGTVDGDEALRRVVGLLVPQFCDWAVADRADRPLVRRVAAAPRDARPPAVAGVERVLSGREVQIHEGDVLVLGLGQHGRVHGALTLGRAGGFPPDDVVLARALAERTAASLETARLYEVQRAAAASLQSALLTRLPQPRGLALSATYRPAVEGAEIGGDWYDAIPVTDDDVVVAIGDVVGHDLVAAARMGEIRGMLRTLAYDRSGPPSTLLSRLDRALVGLGSGTLATAALARLTRVPEGFRLSWSNAGHLDPLLLPAGGAPRFLDDPDAHGVMLGVRPDRARADAHLLLRPGDAVLLYTDGLVERRDTSIDAGLARLRQRAAGVDPAELCAHLGTYAVGDDDAALLVVHVT